MTNTDPPMPADPTLEDLVVSLTTEVRQMNDTLNRELGKRPTRVETISTQRKLVVSVVFGVLLLFQFTGSYAHNCGPGARIMPAVRYIANEPVETYDGQVLRELLGMEVPLFCDVSHPLWVHNNHTWPTNANVLGLASYGALGLAGLLWIRQGERNKPRQNRRVSDIDRE